MENGVLPFAEALRSLSLSRHSGPVLFYNSKYSCSLKLCGSRVSEIKFSQKSIIQILLQKLDYLLAGNLIDLIKRKIYRLDVLKEFLLRENFLTKELFSTFLADVIKLLTRSLFLSRETKYELGTEDLALAEDGINISKPQFLSHLFLDIFSLASITDHSKQAKIQDEVSTADITLNIMTTKPEEVCTSPKARKNYILTEDHKEIITYIALAITFFISYKLVYYFAVTSN